MTAPADTAEQNTEAPQPERLPDMEVITGEGERLTVGGIACTVKPIKVKAFQAFMQVLYTAFGPALSQVRLNFADGPAAVGSDVLGLLMLAVPRATDQVMGFLATVLEAEDPDKQDQVLAYLADDPDLAEMIDAVAAVAEQEAPHLVEILGKAQAAWTRVVPLYSKLTTPSSGDGTGSGGGDRSPRHST